MHSATVKNTKDWRDLAPLEGWAKVASVYDGDTIWIITNINNPLEVNCSADQLRKINIRLARIDTPEMKGVTPEVKAKAVAARDHVRDLILDKLVYFKLGNFGIGGESLDSFKRQIGEIYVVGESHQTGQILGGKPVMNLSDHLLEGGYAVPFRKK